MQHDKMKAMNDLPNPPQSGGNPNPQILDSKIDESSSFGPSQQSGMVGSANKEAGMGGFEAGLRDVSAQEVELPKEVAQSGVKVQPTTIPIPAPVSQLGVQPAGQNVTTQTQPRPVPLTDDQIVEGLKQGVTSSWRWLAEFCVRRLKQLHHNVTKTQSDKVTNLQ